MLTIATYDPVYAPWFVGNDPDNGRGFEAALGYRIAQRMGIKPDHVVWQREGFSQLVQPGEKDFDLALGEVSNTPQRQKVLGLSRTYTQVQQAVVALRSNPASNATTVAELKKARLGASAQTTSARVIADKIKPTQAGQTYPSIAAATDALTSGQIDAVVADLPTADYLANSVLDDGNVVGRLPYPAEPVAAVLGKDSKLTDCVNDAIATLERTRVLDRLSQEWLPDPAESPALR